MTYDSMKHGEQYWSSLFNDWLTGKSRFSETPQLIQLYQTMINPITTNGSEAIFNELASTDWEAYFHPSPIESIRRKIHEYASSPEDARIAIEVLKGFDWQLLVQEEKRRQDEIKKAHEAHNNALEPCSRCNVPFPRKMLSFWLRLPGCYGGYCSECVQALTSHYNRTCVICTTAFIAQSSVDTIDLCKACRTKERVTEAQKVTAQNVRAHDMQLAGTLTLKQWLTTLDYFQWKCAYCLREYSVMEHYMPLTLRGGTTVNNIVPSCSRCNTTKRDKHPDDFARLFPADNLARIRAYLASTIANEGVLQSE